MPSKKIFITGGTGFIGNYMVRYLLEQGHELYVLWHEDSIEVNPLEDIMHQLRIIKGSVLDSYLLEDIIAEVDEVYHLAGVTTLTENGDKMFKVNVEGTANIVNAALHVGNRDVLFMSSTTALGRVEEAKQQARIDEQQMWENSKEHSNYAISKFRAECEVWRGIQEGLSALIVNPSLVIGAGDWQNGGSTTFFTRIYKGTSYYPTGGIGMVDVRDVVRITYQLMEAQVRGERFIINAENWTYKDFFQSVAKAFELKKPAKPLSSFMLNVASTVEGVWSMVVGRPPQLTKDVIHELHFLENYYYNNKKLTEQLGSYQWIPIQKSIEQTAQAFIHSLEQGTTIGRLGFELE